MKRYQKMYDHIRAYWELCGKNCFYLSEKNLENFVELSTKSSYRRACKGIREGRFTEEQVIANYPL